MSSVVDKVYDIWEDLEVSYAKQGEGLTRKEYLFKLIAMQPNGTTKLDSLRSVIMKHYEGNEEKCNILSRIFDALVLVDFKEVEEIDNLNVFVVNAIRDLDDSKDDTPASLTLHPEFFDLLNPYQPATSSRVLPWEEHFAETGFTSDVTYLDPVSRTPVTNLVDGKNSNGVIVFHSPRSLEDFVDIYRRFPNDEFVNKAYGVISHLLQGKELPRFVVFLRKDKFTHRAGKVNYISGKNRIPLTLVEKGTVGNVEVLRCVQDNGLLRTPVICIP